MVQSYLLKFVDSHMKKDVRDGCWLSAYILFYILDKSCDLVGPI